MPSRGRRDPRSNFAAFIVVLLYAEVPWAGTRDPCTDCHRERGPEWAAAAFASRYGDLSGRWPHFAAALDAGRPGLPAARRLLAELAGECTEVVDIRHGSTYDAARNDLERPEDVPVSIQERAWTSPVWYTP